MRSLLVLAVTILLCGSVMAKNDDKVKIAVYYESLCPDSKNFLTNQLAPLWRDLRGGIKVKLVPYGKSTHEKVNNHWMFTCHHGENECYGNKIQACILKDKSLPDQEKMDLVLCLMSQAQPDKSLDTCLRQVDKSAESRKLKSCALGEQGASLLASYGDKTAAVMSPLQFVPTIVINEKFDQAIQDEAYQNLKGVVCRVARVRPTGC